MKQAPLAALGLLLLLNAAITPHFLAWQTLSLNLTQVAATVIVAVGMTLVIATGGIDLSVGSLMAVAAAAAPPIFGGQVVAGPASVLVPLAFIVPVGLAGLLGWGNGWLVTRFRLQPFIATLILFIAGRGLAQVATDGRVQIFQNPAFQAVGLGRVLGVPVQAWLMLAIMAGAAWMMARTIFGRHVLAVGGNERAAYLAGVGVGGVKRGVYAISGLCAGLAGLIVIAINSASDANTVGQGMELDAIAAVAVGGTLLSGGQASVLNTLTGALIIQLLRYMLLSLGVPDSAAMVLKAGLIVLAVSLQRWRR